MILPYTVLIPTLSLSVSVSIRLDNMFANCFSLRNQIGICEEIKLFINIHYEYAEINLHTSTVHDDKNGLITEFSVDDCGGGGRRCRSKIKRFFV